MMRSVHYMIHVRNLSDAISLYEKALGFTEVDRHHYDGATLVYMRGKNSALELELVSPDIWPYQPVPEHGRTHVAFAVDNLDFEHQRLTRLGITCDPVSDYLANGQHQTRYFYFYDTEGNQIEFLEPQGRYASQRS